MKVLQNESIPFRKHISQVGFVRLVAIRLEAPGLDFLLLKATLKKASTMMIASGLKECAHHVDHGSAAR